MKKITSIGLITFMLAGVAQAALFEGTGLWSDTARWDTGVVPGSSTDVNIAGAFANTTSHATIADGYTADVAAVSLDKGVNSPDNSGGNLTINDGGTLSATSIFGGKSSRLYNSGTITLTGSLTFAGNKEEAYNYATGTINAGGNLEVDLHFENAGTFTGSSLVGDGTLNLTGGTMTFASQTFFGSLGTLNVSNDGQLIFTNQNIVSDLQALVGTQITGITAGQIQMVGLDTVVNVPEPGAYALLAGCLALTSVMLRRRRS